MKHYHLGRKTESQSTHRNEMWLDAKDILIKLRGFGRRLDVDTRLKDVRERWRSTL
jgi:hypothetical protein